MVNELSEIISKRRDEYYYELTKKLTDPQASSKAYWLISKSFYSSNEVPLFLVNNCLVLCQILKIKGIILMNKLMISVTQLQIIAHFLQF